MHNDFLISYVAHSRLYLLMTNDTDLAASRGLQLKLPAPTYEVNHLIRTYQKYATATGMYLKVLPILRHSEP